MARRALRPVRAAALAAAVAAAGLLPSHGARAQDLGLGARAANVLVIDGEAAFAGSRMGKRLSAEIEEKSKALAAENRTIEAQLSDEEKALTERRKTLSPEEFRPLADAFDEKVRRIRDEQDAKARAIGQIGDYARRAFLTAARPILDQIMQESGAVVILELRNVFLVDDAANITDEVIRRLDAAEPPADTPGQPPAESSGTDGTDTPPAAPSDAPQDSK